MVRDWELNHNADRVLKSGVYSNFLGSSRTIKENCTLKFNEFSMPKLQDSDIADIIGTLLDDGTPYS